jgi:thioredoxin-like negative regulator of GroEL
MEKDEAQQLLAQQKYREAAKLLDRLLSSDNENGELWYLRAVASLKMKNYGAVQEYLERALFTGRKAKYYQMKGMAYFEIFEVEPAIESFQEAIALEPTDVTSNFFIAICYMLLDDPRSADYIKRAREINSKKTRQLLLNFYTLFLKDDPYISDALKKKIMKRIKTV